ncbi:MAG TPA: protein-disulfide reductase DsbD domain-containing protein [Tepidisphaeraceae bacterium]|jgi:suppressor for copper-sensitivity B|nr:protein-disulfide reductase DsbD domain-containing protein [Tepidisphaeraceae bacterium]
MRTKLRRLGVAGTLAIFLSLCTTAGARQHGEITSTAVNYSALKPGQKAWAAVVIQINEGLHAQSHTPLDENFIKFEVKPDANPAVTFGDPKYPPGKIEDYPALGKLSVYTGKVVIFVPLTVKSDARPDPLELTGKVMFQACDDKVCYPPESPKFTLETEIATVGAPVKLNEPDLFKDVASAESSTAPPQASAKPAAAPLVAAVPSDAGTIATRFLTAFLAGLIFNLMPCVLPVLPLKAIGFYNASQHSRARSLGFGAVFSLGLIATFAAFGILIFVFQAFNWGQLFTYTWFQLFIVIALLILAASTLGLFTVKLPTAIYSVTPRHDTYLGNFLFGILTAVFSTPCTFGLFVALLGWAISLNWPLIGVLMLIMVGLGMAFPYLILSASPELARRFPRTGPWGELVKQMMGLLLLIAAVYFARPFIGRVIHGEAFWWVPFALIVLGSIYLAVRVVQFSRTMPPRIFGGAIALILIVGSLIAVLRLTEKPFQWEPFTPAALDQSRGANRIVLVEFTADWCANCQYVEARVLKNRNVVSTVKKHDVVMLKADVTTGDAPGRPLLDQLNPAGSIPLTVIYAPNRPNPIELTGIYSVDDLQRAITLAAEVPTSVAQTPG